MSEKNTPKVYWHVHPISKSSVPEDFSLGKPYTGRANYWGEKTAMYLNSHNQFLELLTKVNENPNQMIALLPESASYKKGGFGREKIDELVRRLEETGKLVDVGTFPGINGIENLRRKVKSLLESELMDCDHIITGNSVPNCDSRTATMIGKGIVYAPDNNSLVLTDKPIARPKRIYWDPKYMTTDSPDGIVFLSCGLGEGTQKPFVKSGYDQEERIQNVSTVDSI